MSFSSGTQGCANSPRLAARSWARSFSEAYASTRPAPKSSSRPIGPGVHGRSARPTIARCSNDYDTFLIGRVQDLLKRRIMRADEAHIENPGAIPHGPINSRYENMRGRLRERVLAARAESAHRQDFGFRRCALDQAVGADDPGYGGTVVVRHTI